MDSDPKIKTEFKKKGKYGIHIKLIHAFRK